ncbi:unnamed protein product [Neospora caninum Liverpool]|uniref:Rhoptry kinase family protein ROP23 (Incomplete catalytic triad), putative n=1 Tax=Neospora caninum (strain Liverpool) TaxID=572307 RepID=F0VDN7_NEOCL|nr:uncharacterized protein NCLIV_016220 [Neospora caninum Liverpool]CBZ51830.1 unnamed protein product [Neospora caninum Liverpool]CEL65788.1 TPA: Rhoptry kinase family protein ROP23 (incomplete catalytic triad), putative [Neospora caninum Liverpool]|eukprot:XP_003881863.1 uncharacterized protein NCLIV_016220 [Neospora caninum Liverpool]
MEKILWAAAAVIAAHLASTFTAQVYAKDLKDPSEPQETGNPFLTRVQGSFLTNLHSDDAAVFRVASAEPTETEQKAPAAAGNERLEVKPFSAKSRDGSASVPSFELHAFNPLEAVVQEPKEMLVNMYRRLGGKVKKKDLVGELLQRLSKAVFPLFRRLPFWGEPPAVFNKHPGHIEGGREAVGRVLEKMGGRPVPPVYEDARHRVMLQTSMGILQRYSPLVMNSMSGEREVTFRVEDYRPVPGWGVGVGVVHQETNQEFLLISVITLADAAWGSRLEWKLRHIAKPLQTLGLRDPREAFLHDRLLLPLDLLEISRSKSYFVTNRFVVPNLFVLMPKPVASLSNIMLFISATNDVRGTLAVRLSLTCQTIRVVAGFNNRGFVHADLRPASFLVSAQGVVFLGIFNRAVAAKRGTRVSKGEPFDVTTAPELFHKQTKPFSQPDRKTDAWALGVTIYYIWCNRFPFGLQDGDSKPPPALLEGVPPDFSFCVQHMPDIVKVLIGRLLDRQRITRFTASEVLLSGAFRHLQELLRASESSALFRTPKAAARWEDLKQRGLRRRHRSRPYKAGLRRSPPT